MANLGDLNSLFSRAYSIRFRQLLNSLHIDIPDLDNDKFSQLNILLKAAALDAQLSLALDLKNEKLISLTIQSGSESIIIEKLRPMYSLKQKLEKSSPETVELCLFNYRYSGMYIGTKFKLKLEK